MNGAWFTLTLVAAAVLMLLVVPFPTTLVSAPIFYTLSAVFAFTLGGTLYNGIDFKTYNANIQYIEFVLIAATVFKGLVSLALALGAVPMAIAMVAIFIAVMIGFGIYALADIKQVGRRYA